MMLATVITRSVARGMVIILVTQGGFRFLPSRPFFCGLLGGLPRFARPRNSRLTVRQPCRPQWVKLQSIPGPTPALPAI